MHLEQISYLRRTQKSLERFIRHFREMSILLAINAKRRPSTAVGKESVSLIYLDAGLHSDGLQLRSILDWLPASSLAVVGFEANPNTYADCLTNVPAHPNTTLINVALVGPRHKDFFATLWTELPGQRAKGLGVGDSLFSERGHKRGYSPIRVPARRLTTLLDDLNLDPKKNRVILRMNIEGAELDVLQDLDAEGLLPYVDMFMGTWDDVGKISHERGRALKRLVRTHRIIKVPFANNHYSGVFAPVYLFLIRRTILRLSAAQSLPRCTP